MKKIVFFVSSMGKGGAERVVSILANSYINMGWEVDICMLLHNIISYDINKKVNIINLSYEKSSFIKNRLIGLVLLRNYVKNNPADIYVPFLAKISVLFMMATFGLNLSDKRIISSERIDPYSVKYSKILRILVHMAFLKSDNIVFQTKKAKSFYSKKIQDKGIIIGNPINLSIEAKENRHSIIITAGRLVPQKNQKMLIRAFARVSKEYPEYQLHIYGEGKLRQDLEKEIKDLKMSDKIYLKGESDNYLEKLSLAEIFVLSSDYEGLSNALLEALLMGIPTISTNCAGAEEIIENYENGILVEKGNQKELEKKLRELISNKNLQQKLSNNAKKLRNNFLVQNVISKWNNIIEGKNRNEIKEII